MLSHTLNLKILSKQNTHNERNNNFHIVGYTFYTQWLSINADWGSLDWYSDNRNVYRMCVAMVIKKFHGFVPLLAFVFTFQKIRKKKLCIKRIGDYYRHFFYCETTVIQTCAIIDDFVAIVKFYRHFIF